MRRRALLGLGFVAVTAGAGAVDFVPGPPAREQVSSPDGRFVLEIATDPRAQNGRATGTMRRSGAVVWQRRLDAPMRPRFALVADDGSAALIGCWQNIPADAVIEVLNPDGSTRARLDAMAIGLAANVIAAAAKQGTWLDRVPRLEGGQVLMGAGGRALVLDLKEGRVFFF